MANHRKISPDSPRMKASADINITIQKMFYEGFTDQQISNAIGYGVEIVRKRRYKLKLFRMDNCRPKEDDPADIEANRKAAEYSRRNAWTPAMSSMGWAG